MSFDLEEAFDREQANRASSSQAVSVKDDKGKEPWDLLPWSATKEVVKVLQFGATKYASRNWEKHGLGYMRLFSATMRHLVAWLSGEENASDSGLPHLAHAACNILFLLHYSKKGGGIDDRPKYER